MIRPPRFGFGATVSLAVALCSSFSTPSVQSDELFVADRATDRILGFDPTTGAMTRVLTQLDVGSIPTSLAFGPGGYLYVGNLGSGKVQQIDPVTGDFVNENFAIIGGVGGLAYDAGNPGDPDDDVLYVSEFGSFDGDEVYRFDKDGTMIEPLDVIGTGSSASGRAGVALRDGDLYVSTFGETGFFFGTVLKYDGGSGFTNVETVASDFSPPTLNGANGLTFDSAGDLYVAGLLSQGVMKFDLSGGPATAGTPFGPSIPYPSGLMAVDEGATEVIYVTSLGNDNPADQIYGNYLFPGAVYKFDAANEDLIGGAPFISSGGASDHNDDGSVDGDDLVVWEGEFGATEDSDADADNDGDADGADFLAWQRNVGKLGDFQPTAIALYQPAVATARPVPEPASAVLWAAAGLGVYGVRRRRRR
jgi:hypothetical protein